MNRRIFNSFSLPRYSLCLLVSALALTLSLAVTPSVAHAQEDRDYVKRVNAAIDRGVQFLQQQEGGTGNWERFGIIQMADQTGGPSALATLALLNCGVKPSEKIIERSLTQLRKIQPSKTYVVALQTMVFAEARQARDLPAIQRNVQWLIDTAVKRQGQFIGWSYPNGPGGDVDGSNTQYALLGLYAGKMAGAKIEDSIWKQVRDLYMRDAEDDNGDKKLTFWRYKPLHKHSLNGASFSMTTAGICGLVIARMAQTESEQQLNAVTGVAANCGVYLSDEKIERGMNYIAKHFGFENTPEMKALYYNVYGIERLGRLSGQRFIGTRDWYRAGCDWLITKQAADGSWSKGGMIADNGLLSTSFALLFLSKGRTPILLSKLAYGEHSMQPNGVISEKLENGNIIGWNRKHNDARHLVEFASRELFDGMPLAWQAYDPRRGDFSTPDKMDREVGILVESPILYFNGHKAPYLTGQQKELIKQYIEKGGFVLAEACCGSPEFTKGFAELMAELFPENELKPMPKEHPIWRSYAAISPSDFPGVQCLDRGCRTVVVLSTEPMAGYWEEAKYMPESGKAATNRGERAFKFSANVIAYATGMEPPKQRGSQRELVKDIRDRSPPKGYIKPAQLRIPGEPPPAPAAMRTLAGHLQSAAKFDVILDKTAYREPMSMRDEELIKYKFLYMHGRKAFDVGEEELNNVRFALETGGTLLADACCGKKEFDGAFRKFASKLFPGKTLDPIPFDDVLYSEALNGEAIKTVKRREKSDGTGTDGGFLSLPPSLEGIKVDGRWVIIYSKYDLGCSIEGNKSTDCLGHDRDSALRLATAAVLYSLKR
ncbi:MAG: DUF4159 domain-containing protein [Gemmataceae bacterium]